MSRPMTLTEYLEQTATSPIVFAGRGRLSGSTITRILSGERGVGMDVMEAVYFASDGAVTPNDFLYERLVAKGLQPLGATLPRREAADPGAATDAPVNGEGAAVRATPSRSLPTDTHATPEAAE